MATRPFHVQYLNASGGKVGRWTACASPEGVIRSVALRLMSDRATSATVFLAWGPRDEDSDLFAVFEMIGGRLAVEWYD